MLSLISATFTIFNASRALPNRGKFGPWAPKQIIWPQVTLLSIACVSLLMALGVFYAYWKGGHRRAEKAAIYYTFFAIAFFTFSIIMWSVGAALLAHSKNNGKGSDMWGWACKDGRRKEIFSQEVDYALICRMQVSAVLPISLTSILTSNSSTGPLYAPSSRSSLRSSPSPYTLWYSTDFTRKGDFTNP